MSSPKKKAPNLPPLHQCVAEHLRHYFEAHGDKLPPEGLYGRILEQVEKPLIRETLKATEGNQLLAAEILGINRNTLRKRIAEYKIAKKPK